MIKRRGTPLNIESTLMVMFMVMTVIGFMLMVMIGCSNGNGYITPTNTSIPMVHTETPAPTPTISHTPTPIPLSHDQVQEQVIDVLMAFNKIHNDFVVLMQTTAIFQEQRLVAPIAGATIMLPALDMYANVLASWRETEFEDSDWVHINDTLNNMREAEIEKTRVFKVLTQQLQNAYSEHDEEQLRVVTQLMVEFGQSNISMRSANLQHQILKELFISPSTVNFYYAELFEDESDEIEEPPVIDKM